tara:strand:+ start:701 stop:1018 length:318 start_codon:yes stop_codon:yes gene_type:complete
MKRLLLPLIAAITLPMLVNANEKVPYKMTENEANKMPLDQILSTCYGVSRNHITIEQKIDMLGFAMNLHESAHGNKETMEKDQLDSIGRALRLFPDCFPEAKRSK